MSNLEEEALLELELKSLRDEYHAAKEVWDGVCHDVGTMQYDYAKRRWVRAQEALRQSRKYWREVREMLGDGSMIQVVHDQDPSEVKNVGI